MGAGGFGRETIDVVEAINQVSPHAETYSLQGVVDDNPALDDLALLSRRGVRYLGTTSEVLDTIASDVRYLIGVGSPAAREKIDFQYRQAGLQAGTAIHPRATIGSDFQLAPGTVICAGAQVSTNVKFGAHVHINPGAILGHDARLSDYVSVNPGAIVSGRVEVGSRVLVGAGSIILQGLTVGAGSLVGAGAVVTKDVPERTVVKGVPAR